LNVEVVAQSKYTWELTFCVQPLFGFGDRKLSADDEVTKKPK